MGKKITTIYQTKWKRKAVYSFLTYLRDLAINLYPFKSLPKFIRHLLYGKKTRFVFFVHPRRQEDIFVALPFISFLKYLIPKAMFAKFFVMFPPFVIEKVKCENGNEGIVVSSVALPEWLLGNRRGAVSEAYRGLKFANKIMDEKFFGLGGLWPMVTRRGLALRPYAKVMGKVVTNGHCGTALSIYLMVQRIAELAEIPTNIISVAIVGVGKMGTNLARVFANTIGKLTLVDINDARLRLVQEDLHERNPELEVEVLNSKLFPHLIQPVLSNCHVAVCTTSNLKAIMKPVNIPQDFIVIDDSRPEAIPRVLDSHSKIVLEGGLMKIRGIKLNYDYGFGLDENVFGCFAETYILALDRGRSLSPTLGEISIDNFMKMKDFCESHNIEVGSFMSSSEKIQAARIRTILKKRHEFILAKPAEFGGNLV